MKAFLAGKRGICPDCDAKFLVPKQSGGIAESVEHPAELPSTEPAPAAAPPTATLVEPPPIGSSDALPPTIDQSLPDTWYVRPVSGEQYGPANTALMQAWAAEGRIAEDSWVWRTGWDNWKIAHEVFELLKPASTAETPATPVASATPAPQIDLQKPEQPLTPKPRQPRTNSRKERARRISVALGTLVLVLTVALVLVLWYQ